MLGDHSLCCYKSMMPFLIGQKKQMSPIQIQTLLMNDPLVIFQQYDVMGNGKLNLIEFKRMLSDLYVDDERLSERDIVETFQNIANRENVVEYKQSVHDLHSQLKRLKSFPSREQFLKLLINVMAQKHTEKYHDLTLSPSETVEDPIKSIKRIHRIFMERIESNQTFQFANFTVEELWRWIEDHGIVALEENDRLQHEIATLRHSKSVNDSKQTMLQSELDVKDHAVNELKKLAGDLRTELNSERAKHRDLSLRHNASLTVFERDARRRDETKNEIRRLEAQLLELDALREANEVLKQQNAALQREVETLMDVDEIQRKQRRQHSNDIPLLFRQATNHGGGFAVEESGDEGHHETSGVDDGVVFDEDIYDERSVEFKQDATPRIKSPRRLRSITGIAPESLQFGSLSIYCFNS